jgi:hypothetical protein
MGVGLFVQWRFPVRREWVFFSLPVQEKAGHAELHK